MHTKITNLYFALTKLATGNIASKEFPELTQEEWHAMYATAKMQAMAGVIYEAIEKLPPDKLPPRDLRLKWFAATEHIKAANRQLNKRAAEASMYFEQHGFDSIILKGQGVALLYPSPLLRTPGDIDIWLCGGRKKILSFTQKMFPQDYATYHHVDFPLWNDTEIEVHFTPSWMYSPRSNLVLQKFFSCKSFRELSMTAQLPENAGKISVPNNEFNIVFLLVHAYRHLFIEGIGLRQLMDYYFLLSQSIAHEDKANAIAMINKLNMQKFAAAVMYVMREVFGIKDESMIARPNQKAGELLLENILEGGNFGKYAQSNISARGESRFARFWRLQKRNLKFATLYTEEVFWSPFFRLWQYLCLH